MRLNTYRPPIEALTISRREVALLAQCGSDERWNDQLDQGIAEARALLAPAGRTVEVSASQLEALFTSETTPVAEIAARALNEPRRPMRAAEVPACSDPRENRTPSSTARGRVWAFVATIGDDLEERVRSRSADARFL